MEAAWQLLDKPKDEQKLASLKLDLIRRLLEREISKEKIKAIMFFIALYVNFENSEVRSKFEQELMILNKFDPPIGIVEAVQEELKRQAWQDGLQAGHREGLKQGLKEGHEQGLEQGLELGLEQGLEQGLAQGEAKRGEDLLNHAVPELFSVGLDAEKIASILDLPLEAVNAKIQEHLSNE